ncbi:MAG: dephospho-CoA kinase [Calditrichaeota bacterium]|nr:dephospho-CoA kinase [Calditrichota bacterium]
MTDQKKPFLVVGVTGIMGSGKTTVSRFLEEKGARVINTDALARRLMEKSDAVREKIRRTFGEDSYTPDGRLNAKKMASLVFENPEALNRLNSIVHPEVIHAIRDEIRKLAQADFRGILVVDAPLIFETGLTGVMDEILVVAASEDVCVQRVMARSGLSAEEVRARLHNQWPLEKKIARADRVIWNDGTLEQLKEQVEKIYRDWQKRIQ